MKTGKIMLIFVFLTGLMLGATQPALLYAAETPSGNPWDQFVYTKPFKGTTLSGVLSIYYEYTGCDTTNCPGDCAANMFYIVNLIEQNQPTPFLFQGSSQASYPNGICLSDVLAQGTEILNFFGNIVSGAIPANPPLFPNGVTGWHVTAIDNGQVADQTTPPPLGSRAFFADVVITVRAK